MPNEQLNNSGNKSGTVESVKKWTDHINKLNLPIVNTTLKPLVLYGVAWAMSEAIQKASLGYLASDNTHDPIQNALLFLCGSVIAPLAQSTLYKLVGDGFSIKNIDQTNNAEISLAESLRRMALFMSPVLRVTGKSPITNKLLDYSLSLYNQREWIYSLTGCHPGILSKSALATVDMDFFSSNNLDYAFVTCEDETGQTCFQTKFNVPMLSKLYPDRVGYLPGKWCKDNDKWVFATTVSKDELLDECNKRYDRVWFSGGGKPCKVSAMGPVGSQQYDIHYYKPMKLSDQSDNSQAINLQEVPYQQATTLVKFDQTKLDDANKRDRFIKNQTQFENIFWVKQQESNHERENNQRPIG